MNDEGLNQVEVSQPPPPVKPAPPPPMVKPEPVKVAEETKMKKKKTPLVVNIVLMVVVVLAGLATGYALTELFPKQQTVAVGEGGAVDPNQVEAGKVFGNTDDSKFPDTADGVLVKGGIEGEGSHHLMRTGGPSRNVYLTSSVLDLDQFVNHQVEVRGETFNAQKAGWLMDVGQVKVVTLNAPKPFEEEAAQEVMPE